MLPHKEPLGLTTHFNDVELEAQEARELVRGLAELESRAA